MTWKTPEDEYLDYLTHTICVEGVYEKLCRTLFSIPFRAYIANDENREEDVFDMRNDYFRTTGSERFEHFASMLEVLITLAMDMQKEVDSRFIDTYPEHWFAELLGNLGLDVCTDGGFDETDEEMIEAACERVNSRSYDSDGSGGLFPLEYPPNDCRSVELVFQMKQYMYERYYTME